ncbi:MAG TPA: DUF1508 domain-containing protein, partial [Rhodanobacter sp.]
MLSNPFFASTSSVAKKLRPHRLPRWEYSAAYSTLGLSLPSVEVRSLIHKEIFMYYEVYQSGLQWRWRLKAANHQILASGESYVNKQDCIHAVNLLKQTNA